MKPIQTILKHTRHLVTPILAALSIGTSQGQIGIDPIEIEPIDPPCPNLLARDIQQENPSHTVRLVFPAWPDIDTSSLSDGDLIAHNPNGSLIPAEFVSFSREFIPFPQALDSLPGGINEVAIIPQPAPVLVAVYRFQGPGNDGWDSTDNGGYRVALAQDEILTESGRALPRKALGGFRCVIRDVPGTPIQPERLDIRFRRVLISDGTGPDTGVIHYLADVTMTFNTPHVEIDWGQAVPSSSGFLAQITATELPIPPPLTPVPLFTAEEISRSNSDGVDAISADQRIFIPTFRHTYRLGALPPGTYPFTAQVNGIDEGSKDLVISPEPPIDIDPPEAQLAVRNITLPNNNPVRMAVTYRDAHAIDPATLGNGDLAVFSPCLHLPLTGLASPCSWQAQRVRLEEVIPLNDDFTKVKVIYSIEPPRGGWTAQLNGFYPVALLQDEVCDRLGNCVDLQRLGGFEVAIDDSNPSIPATAEIRVDSSNPSEVRAKVHVEFEGFYAITETRIRRDGQQIFLIASAEPLPISTTLPRPPFPQEDLLFEIGALQGGDYVAAFILEGYVLDREKFSVAPTPPIPADVDLVLDYSDPENVSAQVTIQFRTPHRVSQGDTRFQGNRIILPARAEPLPIPLTETESLPPLPAPVVLNYRIGALDPGGYTAGFLMNDFPYAVEEFLIGDPGPPIDASAAIEIEETDSGEQVAVVNIRFASPHVITGRDLVRRGNYFILQATARPAPLLDAEVPNLIPIPQTVTLRYPLGDLPAGDYGAVFVMNNFPYARESFTIPGPDFRADVQLAVRQSDAGIWVAKARIQFENPRVRLTDPGRLSQEGHIFSIDATAELVEITDASDLAPEFYELEYEIGELEPGPYWLRYYINGHFEEQTDFYVQPFPARVDLEINTSQQPITAQATIQFREHYRITDQNVTRLGNFLIMTAEAEGPLPLRAPLPPQPIVLDYDLGQLERGEYFAIFLINGHYFQGQRFRVQNGPWQAEVDLTVNVSDAGTRLKATVDIDDPFVIVTDVGTPVIEGNRIKINAIAERVTFVTEPSGDPMCLNYDLGELPPGLYQVSYSLNGNPEAQTRFRVEEPCNPLPHVIGIRVSDEPLIDPSGLEGPHGWYAKVTLALLPGQHVTDWGVVRQSGNEFHTNITVECRPYPDSPVPVDPVAIDDPSLPAGIEAVNEVAHIGGVPIRLVSHFYRLGQLPQGEYSFCVHSRGQTLACQRFRVPGDPPQVELAIANITTEQDEHRFALFFSDPTGLDNDSIQEARVWVIGRDNFREQARLLSYASTDDVPSSGANARYAINGPGGSWDRLDNGRYRILIENDRVCDLQGNCLEREILGEFKVRIAPPPSDPGINVSVALTTTGNWQATVEIISEPGQQVVVDSWGPLIVHGDTFVVLADVHREATTGPVEPLAHIYDLGQLVPGDYLFVWKSDETDCGHKMFTVPGFEAPGLTRFLANNRVSGSANVGSYFFALNDQRTQADVTAEIVTSDEGTRHLGIRFRRLFGASGVEQVLWASSNLIDWTEVTAESDLIERIPRFDGTEEVLLCLRQPLNESNLQYLRLEARAE